MNASPPSGMELAQDPGVPPPSRFHVVRDAHLRAAATEWIRLRPYRMVPGLFVVGTLLYVGGFPRPRIAAIVAIQVALFAYHVVESIRARKGPTAESRIFTSHLIILSCQSVIVALTGGLAGPLWPGLLSCTMGTAYTFGRGRETNVTVAYAALLVIALAILPPALTGPPIVRTIHVALCAWSLLFSLFLLRLSAFTNGDTHSRTGEALDKMREDVIHAAEARARSLEVIGSKVAHELKNPLSAVKGLAQLLGRSVADERSRERIEVIGAEVTRMEGILRDYLSFSRPLEDLQPQPVDLAALADDVIAVMEARAEAAGVALERRGAGAVAAGDPRRLKEALINLVANAIEATPRGGSVEVALAADGAGADVAVRDTGRGIAPEDLARVGTPFFTTREGGTGLGFVLARAVVRQHGGDLAVDSAPGRGTTVKFRLPARCAAGKPLPGCGARSHG